MIIFSWGTEGHLHPRGLSSLLLRKAQALPPVVSLVHTTLVRGADKEVKKSLLMTRPQSYSSGGGANLTLWLMSDQRVNTYH